MLAPSSLKLLLAALPLSRAARWVTYDVPHTNGADDIPALVAALATGNITSNATIRFAANTTYNAWSAVQFPTLTNVELVFEGNVSHPDNITKVQAIVGSSSFPGAWFTFSGGTNVTLRGSKDPNWGWIDGHGQAWWDAQNQINRPHEVAFKKIQGGAIHDMKIWKPTAWCYSTSGSSNLHIFDNTILAVSDTDSFPFNTDGFDAGGTNIVLERNHVENGDDCVTIGSGSYNITARDIFCANSHGMSIGSLGSNGAIADVQNILFENIFIKNSLYAARFKSWTGGNGLARNITWRNITFDSVKFPIYITQNYWDQGVGPRPNSTSANETHIADFLFDDFKGTIDDSGRVEGSCVSDPCWYAVTNATGKEVVIFDLYPNSATNILVKDLQAKTLSGAPVAAMCNPSTISNDVGFECIDGPFIPTAAGM